MARHSVGRKGGSILMGVPTRWPPMGERAPPCTRVKQSSSLAQLHTFHGLMSTHKFFMVQGSCGESLPISRDFAWCIPSSASLKLHQGSDGS
eukprot:5766116-Amphidinium_carterae.1